MGRFEDVKIEIVIGKDCASDRRYPDDFFTNFEGINAFRDQPVRQTMAASGTISERDRFQALWSTEYLFHLFSY